MVVDNKIERAVASYFGIYRNTVRNMCQFVAPPYYRRTPIPVSPSLDTFVAIIEPGLRWIGQGPILMLHVRRLSLARTIPTISIVSSSLYRNFKNFSLLAEPLRIWRVSDELLNQLGAEPSRLHSLIQSDQRRPHQGNRRSDNAAGTGFFCQSWRIFVLGAALSAPDDADHCCGSDDFR